MELEKVMENPSKEPHKETRVTVVVNSQGGPWPTKLFCEHCQSYVTSEINPITSIQTHIVFLLMCLVWYVYNVTFYISMLCFG